METNNKSKQERAMEKVRELKGFYIHLTVYLIVNSFISVSKMIRNLGNGESFTEAFWDLGTFFVWLAWGIGLAFHAAKVFGFSVFSKDWEERQIQKYIEEDRKEAEKYKIGEGKKYTYRINEGEK
ncbi:2TM domain-containing protein [Flavobacteriaceae bacterium TP-CH-4]|uniref:2TM domain-containing protein n=1 Tax=Pelagihabitans pacificus TaxID=2696054 RepID=A0A967AUJ7_9FLAO|nr:2TM domain-containing protein [Pelagihabitans pacificus]NHF59455.1 2TM domain-containing protein [Pelagihabitans pacificus]